MAEISQEEVLEALVSQKLILAKQAEAARTKAKDKETTIAQVLIDSKLVSDEVYHQTYAKLLGLPYVSLKGLTIPREVLLIIPESTARKHKIVAFEATDVTLKVAIANPSDRQIVEFIHKKVNKPVTVHVASAKEIRDVLRAYQLNLATELEDIMAQAKLVGQQDNLVRAAEDLPTVRIVDAMLKHAILQDASDIHIEPTEKQVVIRYRVDGILRDEMKLPRATHAGIVARIKVLSSLKIDEHRLPQDGRFKIESEDYKVAFRVSILPVYDGEKIVMRLLDESGRGLEVDTLGMQEKALKIFQRNINMPHGMILVTGPTGSGKTTTLYAAMKQLNTPRVNISTIEDPIEYRMVRINQTQVKASIGLTFSSGLRSLVRQDPDIIMVGEIRDEETASLAINAALTGHLVLSTLHTNSAAGALPRLLDMKVEAFLVASTINVLLAQRLVRRLCEDCRVKGTFNEEIVASIGQAMDTEKLLAMLKQQKVVPKTATWSMVHLYQAAGCNLCNEGYKGRAGIYEVLEFTDEISALISPQTSAKELQEVARKQQGMLMMIEDGFIKVVEGLTSVAEVLRVAKE